MLALNAHCLKELKVESYLSKKEFNKLAKTVQKVTTLEVIHLNVENMTDAMCLLTSAEASMKKQQQHFEITTSYATLCRRSA